MVIEEQKLTKAERREARRAEYAAAEEAKASSARRSRNILWAVIGTSLAVLLGLGIWLFTHSGVRTADPVPEFEAVPIDQVANIPANSTPTGGFGVTAAGAATSELIDGRPTVRVYYDYMCPWCYQFEVLNLEGLVEMVNNDEANFVLYPVSILDGASGGTAYSTRALSAAAWIADRSPDHFLRFHELLFENQPREGGTGLTNAQMADFAREAGVPEDVAVGIADGTASETFGQWVTSVSRGVTTNTTLMSNPEQCLATGRDGCFGTPTITINGERWDGNWATEGELREAIIAHP